MISYIQGIGINGSIVENDRVYDPMIQPEIQDLETIPSLGSTLLPSLSHENRFLNLKIFFKTKKCQSLY